MSLTLAGVVLGGWSISSGSDVPVLVSVSGNTCLRCYPDAVTFVANRSVHWLKMLTAPVTKQLAVKR